MEQQYPPRKSILVSKASTNSYPACWFHIPDENEIIENPSIPNYDVEASKSAMEKATQLTSIHKNSNSEEVDWESMILKYGWTPKQIKLFDKVVQILDNDRLARLANADGKRHEVIQVRVTIDKSADRMRRALATINWETILTQWLHTVLMEYLPPSYLASYLDMMQTLKYKCPSLVDKMIFWKPGNVSQDLLAHILKRPWQPSLSNKYRKLPGSALVVVIPPLPRLLPQSPRVQRFFTLFATMAPILPIQHQINQAMAQKQSLQSIAEQIVSITRSKIQELKAENPDRRLILVGMHASSSLALQVALVEQVSGVVCFGFSYNTVHGPRGQPDDQVLNLTTPILFMIGQNAAKTSEEEVEYFREKLTAPSTIVTIGSADDYLRVSKKKRKLEAVTQEMVDNMIVDEIAEFASKCIQRPLPVKTKTVTTFGNVSIHRQIDSSTNNSIRKRKTSQSNDGDAPMKVTKMKPVKMMRPTSTTANYVNAPSTSDALEMAVQSILPDSNAPKTVYKTMATPQRISSGVNQRLKITAQNQFTTLKPQQQHKFYTIESRQMIQKNMVPVNQRQQNRPNMATLSTSTTTTVSRPSTPSTQIQYHVTSVRQTHTGKLPVQTQKQQSTTYSPPKFTILRQVATTPAADSEPNIFDMPIVYADNEGNIDEDSTVSEGSIIEIPSDSSSSSPNASKKVLLKASNVSAYVSTTPTAVTLTKTKNLHLQKPTNQAQPTGNKTFILNGSVIGRSVSATNIVMPKPALQSPAMRVQKIVTSGNFMTQQQQQKFSSDGKKIEILNNQIIRPALATSASSKNLSFVNIAENIAKTQQPTRLSIPFTTAGMTMKTGQQIVIKASSLKPFTLPNNKQFANLTVKRLNVLPSTTVATTTVVNSIHSQQQKAKIILKPAPKDL